MKYLKNSYNKLTFKFYSSVTDEEVVLNYQEFLKFMGESSENEMLNWALDIFIKNNNSRNFINWLQYQEINGDYEFLEIEFNGSIEDIKK